MKILGNNVFLYVWFGQLVSIIGTQLTGFVLGVWIYQKSGSVTDFSLIYLFTYLPEMLMAPFAGAFVDRCDRRWAMILSDLGSGLSILVITLLLFTGQLNLFLIYIILTIRSSLNAFQRTAYMAAITTLVPQQNFGRANGLVQFAKAVSEIAAPALAGVLLINIQIYGVLLLDAFTFLIASAILLTVRFPKSASSHQKQTNITFLYQDIVTGYQYITQCPGLLALLILCCVLYFTLGMLEVLFTPLVLSFASPTELGVVLSIGGCGYLLGSLFISAWGGPKRKINGIFYFMIWQGLFLFLGGVKHSVTIAALGIFGYLFAYPIILSCNQAIWQKKVIPNLQGRVFGIRHLVERFPSAISYAIAGPIVECIFEPSLNKNGLLAESIGRIIGVGSGRGIGLLLILLGLLHILATAVAYHTPHLQQIEE